MAKYLSFYEKLRQRDTETTLSVKHVFLLPGTTVVTGLCPGPVRIKVASVRLSPHL
jgi:hypothetical protein